VWVAAALVAALLAGLIVFLVVDPFGGDDGSEAQESPPATTSAAPSTSAEPSTEPEPDPTPTPTPEGEDQPDDQAEDDPLAADNIEAFLDEYHELVLDDPAAAYALTGPTLRANISEANYIDYWSAFEDVRVSDIEAVDGQNTATATMELVSAGGGTETSQRVFTLLVRDGRLILDSDFPA
jgi:hypothetical protein